MFGNTQMTLEAAAAGRGFALSPRLLVEDDLRTGLLVQPFDIAIPDPFCFWLLHRRDRAAEARIRWFADWIRAEAGAA
jgi:LysR family glycine cleavage system transcriptional activator